MLADLTTFARNLSWAPALVDCCRAWRDAYRDLLEQRLRASCPDGESDGLLAAFQRLPERSREDFLLAPDVSCGLLRREGEPAPGLTALRRELGRARARLADDGEVEGIPLDFDGDFRFPPRSPDAGELAALRPDQQDSVRRTLAATLAALAEGNAVAHACVCLLTRRLAVRGMASRPGSFSSGSFSKYVGLTLVTNPWYVDTAGLADALVHEAIHAALYIYEDLREPLILDKKAGDGVRSPWTGRTLTCSQYVQACFVWYGLSRLWTAWPAGAGGVSAERIGRMHQRASRGFLARPVEAFLAEREGLVSPRVRDALRAVEEDALAPAGSASSA